jgi:hypothetical protein
MKFVFLGIAGISISHASDSHKQALVAIKRSDSEFALRHLFSTFNFNLEIDCKVASSILGCPDFDFGEFYNDLDETELGRVEQLMRPDLLCEKSHHETLYNPVKLLNNLPIARAIFMRYDEGRGRHQPANYEASFFDKSVPTSYFAQIYEKDRDLAVEMIKFVIDNQISEVTDNSWLVELFEVIRGGDFRSMLLMMAQKEMTPSRLGAFGLHEKRNKHYLEAYLDPTLSSERLFVRCAIAHRDARLGEKCVTCKQHFPEIDWTNEPQVFDRLKEIEEADPSCPFESLKSAISCYQSCENAMKVVSLDEEWYPQ